MKKTLKKTLSIILTILMLVATVPIAFAGLPTCTHSYTNHYCKICDTAEVGYYAGACGAENPEDVIWSLDSKGTLTISGTGKFAVEWFDAPWSSYEQRILNVVVGEGVTNIPGTAFDNFDNAVSLSIPSTVTEIGIYNAFFSEFKLAEGNKTFALVGGVLFSADKKTLVMYPANNKNKSYTVPDGVTSLGKYAFIYSKVKTVTLPDSVISIGDCCFEYSSLEKINFGKNVETIDDRLAFCSTYVANVLLPEKLTEISFGMFWSCGYLENLVIGSNVKTIADDVIAYTDDLETVHFTGSAEQWAAIAKPEDATDKINTVAVCFNPLKEKEGFAATCADGHTAGLYCSVCADYVTGEVIPATDACKDEDNDIKCDVCGKIPNAPDIYVCGIAVTPDNYSDILGDADEGATAYYIPKTNTLVLDGFVYEGEEDSNGIKCNGSLNIEIKGENKIISGEGLVFITEEDAVINIGGTGKLDIEANSEGIYANSVKDNDANVKINIKDSVTINIDADDDGIEIDYNNEIKLTVCDNAVLNIKAVSEGMRISDGCEKVEILVKDKGTLTIDGNDEGIYIDESAATSVTFTDNATVSIKNDDEEGIYIENKEETVSGTVTVSGNANVIIDTEEEGIQVSEVVVTGGSLEASGDGADEGINVDKVTISGGVVKVTGGDSAVAILADSIKVTGGSLTASTSSENHSAFSVTPDFSGYSSENKIVASVNADGSDPVEYNSNDVFEYKYFSVQCVHDEVTDEKVEATCTKTGLTEGSHCAHCGIIFTAQQEIPAKGHADKNGDGICDNGGEHLTCNDCGRPAHGESFIEKLICMIIMFFNFIKSTFA